MITAFGRGPLTDLPSVQVPSPAEQSGPLGPQEVRPAAQGTRRTHRGQTTPGSQALGSSQGLPPAVPTEDLLRSHFPDWRCQTQRSVLFLPSFFKIIVFLKFFSDTVCLFFFTKFNGNIFAVLVLKYLLFKNIAFFLVYKNNEDLP